MSFWLLGWALKISGFVFWAILISAQLCIYRQKKYKNRFYDISFIKSDFFVEASANSTLKPHVIVSGKIFKCDFCPAPAIRVENYRSVCSEHVWPKMKKI